MPIPAVYPTAYDNDYEVPEVPPLCPTLYYALQRNYGRVIVANMRESMEGRVEHMSGGRKRWLVTAWGETYRINCPFCKETRYRLWLPHQFGQPDPANPHLPGSFYGNCFNCEALDDPANRDELYRTLFGVPNRRLLREPPQVQPGERSTDILTNVPMPGGEMTLMTKLDPGHHAWQYLGGMRGFDYGTAKNYELSYCFQAEDRYRPATNRIIAPFYQHGIRVGWQGRYIGEPPNKKVLKYYTMPKMPRRSIVYNHDRSVDHPFVIVCEGITDVWRIGDPAVAICGKVMTSGQRMLLQRSWKGKPIILCLDADAREQSAQILHELEKQGTNPVVNVVLEDGWDPAKLTTQTIWQIIEAQAKDVGVDLEIEW